MRASTLVALGFVLVGGGCDDDTTVTPTSVPGADLAAAPSGDLSVPPGPAADLAVPTPTVVEVVAGDGLMFSPTSVTIPVGGTVRWRNTGLIPHTVTSGTGSAASANPGALFDDLVVRPGRHVRIHVHDRRDAALLLSLPRIHEHEGHRRRHALVLDGEPRRRGDGRRRIDDDVIAAVERAGEVLQRKRRRRIGDLAVEVVGRVVTRAGEALARERDDAVHVRADRRHGVDAELVAQHEQVRAGEEARVADLQRRRRPGVDGAGAGRQRQILVGSREISGAARSAGAIAPPPPQALPTSAAPVTTQKRRRVHSLWVAIASPGHRAASPAARSSAD